MQLVVTELTEDSITTQAPILPNRNLHQTGFAGSLYALAAATGWALVHHKMLMVGAEGVLVVKTATIVYRRPVKADIRLTAELSERQKTQPVLEQLRQNGKAEYPVTIYFESANKRCGHLEATYVFVAGH